MSSALFCRPQLPTRSHLVRVISNHAVGSLLVKDRKVAWIGARNLTSLSLLRAEHSPRQALRHETTFSRFSAVWACHTASRSVCDVSRQVKGRVFACQRPKGGLSNAAIAPCRFVLHRRTVGRGTKQVIVQVFDQKIDQVCVQCFGWKTAS